ncbi:hypothetical protein B0H17DRAFT_1181705 [Mycena rosella]|uniref:Uncharacterized protein n=1 Tax=Mycena rosella TaxID=1033263 RepID=A0AAD7D7F4_MYCRO|nr:hypothetical protein B0H17DRAFT_1181705 [Mycena rosella]
MYHVKFTPKPIRNRIVKPRLRGCTANNGTFDPITKARLESSLISSDYGQLTCNPKLLTAIGALSHASTKVKVFNLGNVTLQGTTHPSPKVAVTRFERGIQQGLLERVSRGSILEYHAFGIISLGADSRTAKAASLVNTTPDLWGTRRFHQEPRRKPTDPFVTRQLKFAGVSNTSRFYKRGIRVCTGTGLGAALSPCLLLPEPGLVPDLDGFRPGENLWRYNLGADPRQPLSDPVHPVGLEEARFFCPRTVPSFFVLMVILGGRPDIMKLLKEVYLMGAEVVFIACNMGGKYERMQGCEKEGMPAFGTLWDF